MLEDALIDKEDAFLAQEIFAKVPASAIDDIMKHMIQLAGCTVNPLNKAILDFIKINKKHLSPSLQSELELLNYQPKLTVELAEENLVMKMSKESLCTYFKLRK